MLWCIEKDYTFYKIWKVFAVMPGFNKIKTFVPHPSAYMDTYACMKKCLVPCLQCP